MAVTNRQIIDYLLANPGMSDAQIVSAMEQFKISPAQMAAAVGLDEGVVASRVAATLPPDQTIQLGGTVVQSQFVTQGTGEDQQIVYRPEEQVQQEVQQEVQQVQQNPAYTAENVNKLASQILAQGTTSKWEGGLPPETSARYMADDLAKSGITDISQVGQGTNGIINKVTGEKLVSGYGERTKGNLWSGSYEGKGNTGFGVEFDAEGKPVFFTQGASSSTLKKDLLKLAAVAGAVYGLGGFGAEGLFSGAGSTAAATEGLTLSELGLNANNLATATNVADIVAGAEGGGLLTKTAADAAAFELQNAGASALTDLSATTQAGLLTGGKTAAELAQLDLATGGIGGNTGATSLANALATGADVSTVTSLTGGSGALTGAAAGITAESVAQKLAADKVLTDAALAKKIIDTGNTITSGLKTVGGLLQTEEDKAAAKLAAEKVTAATQAGVEGSQFRPVGMTTRFGTSNYTYDPVTGRMTSAGYQLSPEAKNAQDRLVKLAESGLQQAEGARGQFAPLQTGAQNLFGLGNQYISQSPQDVAQNYINQQMQLLQPSREMELANLQNRLQQQGRAGLSVAQGGSLGATTPELQALYNARAQQELQLASQAQQAGQQNVLFGAGLLGQGATAMGNYYGGQQAAYSPFTTALGQVQGLETQAQQPLAMGANLAQQASTAGYRAGSLGVQGAQAAGALSTGKAATTNPYASLFSGFDPAFAQGIAKQIWGG
jgi:hypothetical protein